MSGFKGDELRVRTRRGDTVGRREYDYTLSVDIDNHNKNVSDVHSQYRGPTVVQLTRRIAKERRQS